MFAFLAITTKGNLLILWAAFYKQYLEEFLSSIML